MAKKGRSGTIIIDRERCKGCYLCMEVCPNKRIFISDRLNQQGYYPAEFKENIKGGRSCNACAMCATVCPDIAIEVYRD